MNMGAYVSCGACGRKSVRMEKTKAGFIVRCLQCEKVAVLLPVGAPVPPRESREVALGAAVLRRPVVTYG